VRGAGSSVLKRFNRKEQIEHEEKFRVIAREAKQSSCFFVSSGTKTGKGFQPTTC
jgi:hypothetical protein